MISFRSLYIVATPIGNLMDITFRAIDVLQSVDLIAAEDTRHSQRLLSHYQITTPSVSLHEHNEDQRIQTIVKWLSEGKSIALISDAGTPLISDPGFRLVRAVRALNFSVIPIPGACAAVTALVASGLPADRFVFEGFLPVKSSALNARLTELKTETRTIIFYESVHRIINTLTVFCDIFGDERIAVIARELTKNFETIKQDTLKALLHWIVNHSEQQKGEFVIILQGAEKKVHKDYITTSVDSILTVLLRKLSLKQAVQLTCEITGEKRKSVYALALKLAALTTQHTK